MIKISNRELKIVRRAKIEIKLLFIKDKRKQRSLENENSKNSIFSILKFKNLREKKQKKKDDKTFRESLKLKLFIEEQLLSKLFVRKLLLFLNIKLSLAITSRSRTLITKITRFFLQIVTKFILIDRNNNAKTCEYIEINKNFRYKINYCSIILAKILQIVDLIIFREFQEVDYEILFLTFVLYLAY